MSDFYFEQSIAEYLATQQKSGKVAFVLISVVTILCLIFSPGINWTITIIVSTVILYLVFGENQTLRQIKKCPQDEKWEVSLKGSQLIWHSPESISQLIDETSFEIDIDQIKTIQSMYNSSQETDEYRLALKDGKMINLKTNSELDIESLIKTLLDREITQERLSRF